MVVPLLAASALLLAASVATSAATRHDQTSAASMTEEELARVGSTTTEKVCTECHGIEDVNGMRRTAHDWKRVIASMVTRGANATDDQLAIITKYLTRYNGSVAVNTAPADELSAVLGLSAKDAQAVVDYRTAHGKFADAAGLSKVPGIDTTKIEAQLDALRFD
jgi:competence ComEA-like helix-hairpin-helix protein